jgi:uncharacterized protein (TIGR02246 family)
MRTRTSTAGVLLSLGLIAAAPAAMAEPMDEVAEATRQWETTFATNDPDRMLALYRDDAVLWGTLSPTVRDEPAELRAYFEAAFKALPEATVAFGEQLIRVYGDDAAINTGYYTFSYVKDGETKAIPARYSFTYIRDGEDWLIVDHHSSAVPAPPQ